MSTYVVCLFRAKGQQLLWKKSTTLANSVFCCCCWCCCCLLLFIKRANYKIDFHLSRAGFLFHLLTLQVIQFFSVWYPAILLVNMLMFKFKYFGNQLIMNENIFATNILTEPRYAEAYNNHLSKLSIECFNRELF